MKFDVWCVKSKRKREVIEARNISDWEENR